MRQLLALLSFVLWALVPLPASAQNDDRHLLEFYSSLSADLRVWLQRGLIWTDHYVGIADGSFSKRSIDAVRSYQRSINQPATGMLTVEQAKQLSRTAQNIEDGFGYRLYKDGVSGVTVGLPQKFVRYAGENKRGTQFISDKGEVDMVTIRIPLEERSLADFYRIHTKKAGRNVGYAVFRGDWFVVNGSEGGKHFYVRAHTWNGEIRGYAISYHAELAPVFARLTTAMSSDFKPDSVSLSVAESRMNWGNFGARFAGTPEAKDEPKVASAPPPPPPATPAMGGPSEKPKGGITTGTGFLVSQKGHYLTNAHVVDGCTQVSVGSYGNASLIDRDSINDLALLKIDAVTSAMPLGFSETGPRLGEEIIALGFPLQTLLQNGLNVTKGDVSSLAGVGGDSRFLQFTAAIQPGNSGGPLVNKNGAVLGVVTSKLNALKVASAIGDFPQSINFAIRPELAEVYLRRHGLPITRPIPTDKPLEAHELIAKIQGAVSLVICTK